MSIRHIVMWQLHEYAEGADRQTNRRRVKEILLTCADIVPGMLRFDVITADEVQSPLEAGCDVLLDSEFADQHALLAYQNHPKHLAIKDFVGAVRKTRQCMDYEC